MKIPDNHLRALIRFFQEADSEGRLYSPGLAIDGIYGPATAGEIDKYIAQSCYAPSISVSMKDVFDSAYLDIGQREDPVGSNEGPFLDLIREETDMPRKGGGEWCAVFLSAHLMRNGIPAKSRGAPGVLKAVESLPGGKEVATKDIGAGFYGLALRKRGRISHHVQIFRCYMSDDGLRIQHIGGNEGNKVKTERHKPKDFFKGVVKVVTYE